MVVRNREELGLAIGEPAFGRGTLGLGTMPIAARVIANLLGGAAIDGRHGPELTEADMSCVFNAPRRPVVTEDIRDLPQRPSHGRRLDQGLVLDEFDQELSRRGHRFCRYADDCNIYVRSRRAGEWV
ncbi:MAG: hypothetical protein OEU26_23150, partial [Candidatus Tectomicrobia bacterium]|nr:hypothetical protein [Candidatus Tectomicrobia bacterium]